MVFALNVSHMTIGSIETSAVSAMRVYLVCEGSLTPFGRNADGLTRNLETDSGTKPKLTMTKGASIPPWMRLAGIYTYNPR